MKRTFEFVEGTSSKFWNIQLDGKRTLVTFGKIGGSGQTKVKDFADEAAAKKEFDKLIREKVKKGYRETTPSKPAAKADSLREALEKALIDNPDDLASHSAYADYLNEQGDPRGEFIQVQLALEDPKRTPAERKKLRQREQELLAAHEREWLGELAPLLLGGKDEHRATIGEELAGPHSSRDYYLNDVAFKHSWSRGWLDRFECGLLSVETARKLGRLPFARLLRSMVCERGYGANNFLPSPGPDIPERGCSTVEILRHYPILSNVRVFQFGRAIDPDEEEIADGTQYAGLAPLIAQMPRIEELRIFGHIYMDDEMWRDMNTILSLPNLTNLRVFQHYHGTTYALEPFATNPALRRLTHLMIFPHSFARSFDPVHLGTSNWIGASDSPALHRENARHIVASPHLKSLTHLQLLCCSGGDAMIQDMADSGILKRLEALDLRHGHVTDTGARLLVDTLAGRKLSFLDLTNNRLTARGIAALQDAAITVRTDAQQEEPFDDNRIMYYGDSE